MPKEFDQDLIDQIRKGASPSMVRIIAYGKRNIPRALAMGFYFRKNLVATNLRILKDAQSLALENLFSNKVTRAVRVKAYSRELDLAVLEVGDGADPLPLSQEDTLKIGQKLLLLAHPKWSERPHYVGTIGSLPFIDSAQTYAITASVSPSRSGGPVFDQQGRVIGIATYALQASQSASLIIPVKALRALADKDLRWDPEVVTKIDRVGDAIGFANYSKKANAKEEFISLRNLTKDTVQSIRISIAYVEKDGKIFYTRIARLKGPISSGLSAMEMLATPKVVWPKAYTKIQGAAQEGGFRVEVVPLDYEVSRQDWSS